MKIGSPPFNLLEIAEKARGTVSPESWVPSRIPHRTALICWGKAAAATARALGSVKDPALAILPSDEADLPAGWQSVIGEHPIPGPGSLAAGARLLDFFDSLRRLGIRRLEIFLSGGASSLAWLPLPGMPASELRSRLEALYALPLPIGELNRRRSSLDQLKAGGAARWLGRLAPDIQARVRVLSDVLPCGPRVVGSGPFWDGRIPHRVVASGETWARAIAREARAHGVSVLEARAGLLGPWQEWSAEVSARMDDPRPGLRVLAGEPQVDLRGHPHRGRGGRQTQLATALLLRLREPIAAGRIEILCLSSDGVDGTSGAAGAWLRARVARRCDPRRLREALARLETASELGRLGALVPARPTGTNVQDAIIALRGSP